MRNTAGENNGFYGKQHTEETRRKMSEAAKQRHTNERPGGYKLLISAVIKQAAKDKAVWFFETETGKNYCAAIGVHPETLLKKRLHIMQTTGRFAPGSDAHNYISSGLRRNA